ncbi:MAG TPA: 4'-phosphopantetheinyl transferase superfamily protein [Candidatus Saccharimonadales bacterium]|nr:4'-phosphopantetheinyl transferase superfamily protein [Candidatus Saccharimonadales bacterium]
MAVLCGVDIVYIPGIKKILNDASLLQKFIDPAELRTSTPEHLAGIIAAKEAFFKALGQVPHFREVSLEYSISHKPRLNVSPKFQTFDSCDVSISHDTDYAVAFVVLEVAKM